MEYTWRMYEIGECKEYAWHMYAVCMEYEWNMCGVCMEYDGLRVEYA